MASQPPQGYSAQHFALIYIDQFGKIHRRVSPSIAHHRDTILSSHVTAEFLKAVACSTEVGQRRPSPENTSIQYFSDQLVSDGSHNSWYQEISKVEGHIMPTKNGYHGNSTLSPGRGISSSAIIKDQVLNKEICFVKDTMEPQAARLSLKDAKSLRQYYEKVFDNLQQVNCRILAKAYVKFVEPQKQVKYPYNGRKAVAGVIQQSSPEESKPPWWPSQVRHREPDHLLKAERITLLVHILCDLRCSHGITSRKLKNAEQSVRSHILPVERLELLDELYRVRGEEEMFLEGELENDATVLISPDNLPAADKFSSKQGWPNSRVSLEYKQDPPLDRLSSRKRGAHNAPKYPQQYFAEYTTGQDFISNPLAPSAMSFMSPAKEHSMIKKPFPSTAICDSKELVSTRYDASHSLNQDFSMIEDVERETQNSAGLCHSEMSLFAYQR